MNFQNQLLQEQRDLAASAILFEGPENPPRFDPPVSLEDRGITQGQTGPADPKNVEWYQQLIWSKATMHKNSVAAKLRSISRDDLARTLEDCHTHYTVAKCKRCGKVEKFPNRCEHKICPECQPRLASDREKIVAWWLKGVAQPKLMTLTVKNVPDLSAGHVEEFQKWWRNLRNRKFASNWIGGFYSLEVTKEGNDWHLHLHAIIDARWIDQNQLSIEWRSVTNGQGYIVDVRDARAHAYQQKVKKYVVKGQQLATWRPEEIAILVDAFENKRCFGVFGSLYGMRSEFAEWWKQIRKSKPVCECGSCEHYLFSEQSWLEQDFTATSHDSSIPPPKPIEHPEFPFQVSIIPPK